MCGVGVLGKGTDRITKRQWFSVAEYVREKSKRYCSRHVVNRPIVRKTVSSVYADASPQVSFTHASRMHIYSACFFNSVELMSMAWCITWARLASSTIRGIDNRKLRCASLREEGTDMPNHCSGSRFSFTIPALVLGFSSSGISSTNQSSSTRNSRPSVFHLPPEMVKHFRRNLSSAVISVLYLRGPTLSRPMAYFTCASSKKPWR